MSNNDFFENLSSQIKSNEEVAKDNQQQGYLPQVKHISQIDFTDEEITNEKLNEFLITDLIYQIRTLASNRNLSDEARDILASCMDGAPDGVYGAQLLSSRLMGTGYKYNKETKQYEKQQPEDAKKIYTEIKKLIDKINEVIDSGLVEKNKVEPHALEDI